MKIVATAIRWDTGTLACPTNKGGAGRDHISGPHQGFGVEDTVALREKIPWAHGEKRGMGLDLAEAVLGADGRAIIGPAFRMLPEIGLKAILLLT